MTTDLPLLLKKKQQQSQTKQTKTPTFSTVPLFMMRQWSWLNLV